MVTVKQLKEILQREYDDDAICQTVYNKLLPIIVKHEGKQITKRIANDFIKANPDLSAHWDDRYGMYHLNIYGGNTKREYNNALQFHIGYETNAVVDLVKFPEHNAWAGSASIERNRLRTELLNDDMKLATIAKALNDYQNAHDRIEKLTEYPMTERYTFTKLVNYK